MLETKPTIFPLHMPRPVLPKVFNLTNGSTSTQVPNKEPSQVFLVLHSPYLVNHMIPQPHLLTKELSPSISPLLPWPLPLEGPAICLLYRHGFLTALPVPLSPAKTPE